MALKMLMYLGAALIASGCSDPPSREAGFAPGLGSAGVSAGQSDDDDSSGGPEDDETGAGVGTDGGESSGGPDGTGLDVPAQGIELLDLEVNQGVAVQIVSAGTPVPDTERAAPLLFGRRSLVRASWRLAPGSPERMIEAQLILTGPDGAEHVVSDQRIVGAASSLATADAFEWVVEPEQLAGDARYEIVLRESSSSAPGLAPAPPFPAGGSAPLGVRAAPMRLNIVAIPVTTPGGGVVATPDFKEAFVSRLMATFPVQGVDVTWRTPWARSSILTSELELWDYIMEARAADGGNESYYHVLLDPDTCCDESQGEFNWGGIADLLDAELLSMGWYGDGISKMYNYGGDWWDGMMVMTHELGHNHGRDHAPCGDPGLTDPAFPHPGAGIAVRGYDIMTGEMISPDEVDAFGETPTDFMGYCNFKWWSDYSWRALFERVQLRSQSFGRAHPADGLALRGFVRPGKKTAWRIVPAPASFAVATPAPHSVRLLDPHGTPLATLPAHVSSLGDSDTTVVTADLTGMPEFDHLEFQLGDRWVSTPGAEIIRFVGP